MGVNNWYDIFIVVYDEVKVLGNCTDDIILWMVICNVDLSNCEDICFNIEVFCGVLLEIVIVVEDMVEYIKSVVVFCNEYVWGTLSVCFLVYLKSMKDFVIKVVVD